MRKRGDNEIENRKRKEFHLKKTGKEKREICRIKRAVISQLISIEIL